MFNSFNKKCISTKFIKYKTYTEYLLYFDIKYHIYNTLTPLNYEKSSSILI